MEQKETSAITKDLVTRYYKALSERDFKAVASLFSQNVDWYIPGDERLAPWLGRRRNNAEIISCYELLFSSVEPINVDIEHTFIENSRAISIGKFSSRIRSTGKIYTSMFFAKFVVENNLFTEYYLLEDTLGLTKALT